MVQKQVKKTIIFADLGKVHPQSRQIRLLSLSPVVGIRIPLTPLTRRRVCRPPVLGGGTHSLAREGLGESQFRRLDIYCGTLYIYVLCGYTVVPSDYWYCQRISQPQREKRDKREEGEEDITGAIADMGRGIKSNDCYCLVPLPS
jgi:hypothetical protein